jgi:general secretion pathway protein D
MIDFRTNYSPVRYLAPFLILALFSSCGGGSSAFKKGTQLDVQQNYDEALAYYEEALKQEPKNHEYRLYYERARFRAAIAHFDRGRKLKEAGNLDGSLAEFQRASAIDPSNALAAQEMKSLQAMIADRENAQEAEKRKLGEIIEKNKALGTRATLSASLTTPITLKLTKDLKTAYDTIAKLGGINVIFDQDLGNRLQGPTLVDLTNVSIIEALDLLSLQTKTYWTVVNKNTILVANDNQQTRQLYEEQIIKTFYLGNSLAATDLAETITMLRLLLTLSKVAQITAQNAIVIRDTPAKIAMAEKILQSIDKAKPEVLIEVAVLEVDRNLDRTLGVTPPAGTSITFQNGTTTTGSTTTPNNSVSIKDLGRIGSGNFFITIPSTAIDFVSSQSHARVLQNPSLRAADGKPAKLRIGTKQPVAQGSFQPTFAGNIGGTPVVNFQTIDVGVNLDMTPHVMLNRDIAMTIKVGVNAISGSVNFSGIPYPILTNREIEHDIRLKEGESSIIGGIITDADAVTVTGLPGAAKIPLIRYLFSSENKQRRESEIIIVITPHIVRLPEYLEDDYGSIALMGAGNSPRFLGRPIQLLSDAPPIRKTPPSSSSSQLPSGGPALVSSPQPQVQPATATASSSQQPVPRLSFVKLVPSNTEVASGTRIRVAANIENAQNAYAFSFNLSFNPKVLKLIEVENGGFLSNDGKIIALSPRIENEAGQAVVSMTRPPESSGVSGNGSLIHLVFEAVAAGISPVSFTQGNVRDLAQSTLPASFSNTQVTVK